MSGSTTAGLDNGSFFAGGKSGDMSQGMNDALGLGPTYVGPETSMPAGTTVAGDAVQMGPDQVYAGGSPEAMAILNDTSGLVDSGNGGGLFGTSFLGPQAPGLGLGMSSGGKSAGGPAAAPMAAPAPTSPGLARMQAQGQMARGGRNPLQGAAPMNISASQIGPGGINNRATYGAQPANPNFQGGLRPAPSNYRPPRGSQPMLSPNTMGRGGYQPANAGMPVNAMPGRTASGQLKSFAVNQLNAQPQQRAVSQPMIGTFGGPLMAQGRFFNR